MPDRVISVPQATQIATRIKNKFDNVNGRLTQLSGQSEIVYTTNTRVVTNTDPVVLEQTAQSGFDSAIVECADGDVFKVSGYGTASSYIATFTDASGNKLDGGITVVGGKRTDVVITAPANAAYLVLNNYRNNYADAKSYSGEYLVDRVEENEEKIATMETDVAELKDMSGQTEVVYTTNTTVATNTDPIAIEQTAQSGFNSAIIPCVEGDVFKVSGYGTASAHIAEFVDSNGNILTGGISVVGGKRTDVVITAPANVAYLILNNYRNNYPDAKSYIGFGLGDRVAKNEADIAEIKEDISDIGSDISAFKGAETEFKRGYIGYNGRWNESERGYVCLFTAKEAYYYMRANGEHNRFILYGSTDGTTYTEVYRIENANITEDDSYTYHNTEYTSLLLALLFADESNPHIPDVEVSVYEGATDDFSDFSVFGVKVPTMETLGDSMAEIRAEMAERTPYKVRFSTIAPAEGLTEPYHGNLYLIAVKTDNTYYGEAPNGRIPTPKGYLYLDQTTQKLYYSVGVYNRPEYLCDWDMTVSGDTTCDTWHCTITKDGDLIFIKRPRENRIRREPIIYPHGDYTHPYVINFGDNVKPFGFIFDSAIDHCYNDDFFMFAEYRAWYAGDNDTELYVWKVVKPYNTVECWQRVLTQYVRHYDSGEGSHPGQEIGHFHTVNWDFYSGAWIASTGDVTYQCKFFMSKDKGATWTNVTNSNFPGQLSRTVGMIFTPEGIYYQTDSTVTNHKLFFIGRDADGYPDFSTQQVVCELSKTGEAGYGTALMREPYGLVFIDRMENGGQTADTLHVYFYDLKKRELVHLTDLKAIENYTRYDTLGRFGIDCLAFTHYQSPYENGIIMGGTIITKPMTVDVAGNKEDLIIGVLKEEIL